MFNPLAFAVAQLLERLIGRRSKSERSVDRRKVVCRVTGTSFETLDGKVRGRMFTEYPGRCTADKCYGDCASPSHRFYVADLGKRTATDPPEISEKSDDLRRRMDLPEAKKPVPVPHMLFLQAGPYKTHQEALDAIPAVRRTNNRGEVILALLEMRKSGAIDGAGFRACTRDIDSAPPVPGFEKKHEFVTVVVEDAQGEEYPKGSLMDLLPD